MHTESRAEPLTPRSPATLYLLIASLPFSDFLQTAVVAFSAAPVMGGIAASPDEYSLVATLYAVVAITVIAMHRQLLACLGWRRLLQGAAGFFALGAVVCGLSESLFGFASGRMAMALGCASFMTAGRVLVNHIPPSPRRFTSIKFFAAGLAWGGVAGPWLAAAALAAHSWRWGFLRWCCRRQWWRAGGGGAARRQAGRCRAVAAAFTKSSGVDRRQLLADGGAAALRVRLF